MFDELTFTELAALSAKFRSAREKCRKRMLANWDSAPVTESYRALIADFQAHDPLFRAE